MKQLQKIPLFLLVFFTGAIAGQQQFPLEDSVDSRLRRGRQLHIPELSRIQEALKKSKRDSNQVKLLIRLSAICSLYDSLYNEAVEYAERAFQIADETGYDGGIVNALRARGYAEETIKRNWNSAVVYYEKAITTAKEKKLVYILDTLYSIIHNAYVYQGNFPGAMSVANKGLEEAIKRKDRVQTLHYSSLIAVSYFRQNFYDESLMQYERTKSLFEKLNEDEIRYAQRLVTIADIYYGLADVYLARGDKEKALQYFVKSYSEFIELRRNKGFNREYMISNTLFKQGVVAMKMDNPGKALDYSRTALDSCNKWGCNDYEKAAYYLLAGDALRQTGKMDEASRYLYQGKRIAEKIRHAENARDAYKHLSQFYADKQMFDSAWFYTQRYIFLKDSISNERTRFQTQQIVEMYRSADKDKQIARQNNLRNILIASFLGLLLTLGFLYNRYRLRQHNRYQQELNRQQNELFNAISLAQEQERKRIAQDIHDSLGSVLSAAKLKLAEVKEGKPELYDDEKFLSGINLIDEASAELRNISHNIMPATLSKLGLVPAIKNLTQRISSHKGLQVFFIAYDFEKRPDEQTEISIYRIVLELINNIVKHADATKATVQLIRHPDHINITVEDNGKGFDVSDTEDEKSGIGLSSIAARVDYLKGKMDIDSKKGKGTTVIIDIPAES